MGPEGTVSTDSWPVSGSASRERLQLSVETGRGGFVPTDRTPTLFDGYLNTGTAEAVAVFPEPSVQLAVNVKLGARITTRPGSATDQRR